MSVLLPKGRQRIAAVAKEVEASCAFAPVDQRVEVRARQGLRALEERTARRSVRKWFTPSKGGLRP